MKDGVYYTIPSVLSKGVGFLLIPLLTKVLSPTDYGVVDLFGAFIALINLTIALEISQGVARFYSTSESEVKKREIFSTGFWFSFLVYTAFGVITIAFSSSLSNIIFGINNLKTEFEFGILASWFGGLYYLIQNQFRWELKSRLYMWVSVFVVLTTFLLSYYLTYKLKLGVKGVFLAQMGGSIVGLVLGLFWLRNSFQLSINKELLFKLLKFSSPLVLSGISIFFTTYCDRIMLGYLLSVEDVGLYGVAFRFSSVVGLVLAGFQGAVSPLVFSNAKKPETPKEIATIFRYFSVISLMLFFFIGSFAPDLIRIFTTSEYVGASSSIIMLLPSLIISQLYIFTPGIFLSNRTKSLIWINFVGAIANVLFNYLLISAFGLIGASIATFVSATIVFSFYVCFTRKYYPIPFEWARILAAFIFTVVLVVFAQTFAFEDVYFYWKVLLSIPALVLILFFMIKFNEFSMFYQRLRMLKLNR